ncbi:NADH-quinone oxidoreductase subunit C [Alcaligenaceae bacterium LF4-65]|jgi:NADH-quinone oxidoreductase subunit C|uniref:NADH-quinone oxidoreductase subunit C n=2 Tax=Pseudomonadota TaxID=1224 RepID=A0A953NE02_9BURK|nr:NADH-quinone oxidoreductase subunit C [Zwartia hollandica]MBZ1351481.1 NADH-quinone oxidoreductase subunit C [Zwartia hollandica]
MSRLENLQQQLMTLLGEQAKLTLSTDEITLEVSPDQWLSVCQRLRDEPALRFETCIDLCGLDYLTYGAGRVGEVPAGAVVPANRFAVVAHLLSLTHNCRLRVRTFLQHTEFPVLDSLVEVWPSVNWFEREAFDLFGIVFEGHPDLRRILTDYGFIGHPFRKDFPVYGNVEMRYDPEQGRVVYQPVTIDPREVIPRVIREDGYGMGR